MDGYILLLKKNTILVSKVRFLMVTTKVTCKTALQNDQSLQCRLPLKVHKATKPSHHTLSQIYTHLNWNSKLNTKLRLDF